LPQVINANAIQHLITFFDERFMPGPLLDPLIHGLNAGNPVSYTPQPEHQHTWAAINNALKTSMDAHNIEYEIAPLGERAAIIDVVPWKFRAWGQIPRHFKEALIVASDPYFDWAPHQHGQPPALVIAAGEHARRAMHRRFPELPGYAPRVPSQEGAIQINGEAVPWRGVPAPTAHGHAFGAAMQAIDDILAEVLAL
jgi:hypothetical protein